MKMEKDKVFNSNRDIAKEYNKYGSENMIKAIDNLLVYFYQYNNYRNFRLDPEIKNLHISKITKDANISSIFCNLRYM